MAAIPLLVAPPAGTSDAAVPYGWVAPGGHHHLDCRHCSSVGSIQQRPGLTSSSAWSMNATSTPYPLRITSHVLPRESGARMIRPCASANCCTGCRPPWVLALAPAPCKDTNSGAGWSGCRYWEHRCIHHGCCCWHSAGVGLGLLAGKMDECKVARTDGPGRQKHRAAHGADMP